jgi:hypothetical protein
MAIDSGDPVEHHAHGEVARGGGVGAGGTLGETHVGGFFDRFLGVFAFGPPIEPGGEPVVAERAGEQAQAGGRAPGLLVRLGHEIGRDRADERTPAECHHEAQPPGLRELREPRDEQRADEQGRLPQRRPQPCFEHSPSPFGPPCACPAAARSLARWKSRARA